MDTPRELNNQADEKEAQAEQLQREAKGLRDDAKRAAAHLLVEAAELDRLARDKKYEGADEAGDLSRQADEVRSQARGAA
jgi:hypothetical protein